MFITFEGIDGSGKSTQSKALASKLREQGYRILLTREPGGTDIGEQVRNIVVENHDNTAMIPQTELLLFCASRAQLVGEVIVPFLQDGGIVICDRYADSTLAYQGYGHGLPLDALRHILHFATQGLTPDVTVYLDLDPRIGLERRQKGRLMMMEEWNRLDDMELAFHQRVYGGYQALIAQNPNRWLVVPADPEASIVEKHILKALKPVLPKKPSTKKPTKKKGQ